MILRHAAASKAKMWQRRGRQMQTVIVTTRGMLTCQGDCATAKNIFRISAEIIFLKSLVKNP